MWTRLVLLALLSNGLSQCGINTLSDLGYSEQMFVFLIFMYSGAMVFALIRNLLEHKHPTTRDLVIGGLAGIGSSAGMYSMLKALESLEGYVVFPVANGGIMIVLPIALYFAFRETISRRSMLGILIGFVAVVLLGLG